LLLSGIAEELLCRFHITFQNATSLTTSLYGLLVGCVRVAEFFAAQNPHLHIVAAVVMAGLCAAAAAAAAAVAAAAAAAVFAQAPDKPMPSVDDFLDRYIQVGCKEP
jgi:hypothetical protein